MITDNTDTSKEKVARIFAVDNATIDLDTSVGYVEFVAPAIVYEIDARASDSSVMGLYRLDGETASLAHDERELAEYIVDLQIAYGTDGPAAIAGRQ